MPVAPRVALTSGRTLPLGDGPVASPAAGCPPAAQSPHMLSVLILGSCRFRMIEAAVTQLTCHKLRSRHLISYMSRQ